ncbi:hypothetical protein OQA88_1402 [Cercophora sp. LCS_1]
MSYAYNGDIAEGGRDDQPTPKHSHSTEPSPPPAPKKSKKLWWFILAGLVILGVILGGALGGTLGRRSSNDSEKEGSQEPAPPSPAVPVGPLLGDTKLAATRWTDLLNNTNYAVFYQDRSGELTYSHWNSSTKKWNETSISGLMDAAGRPIKPLNGTALAVDNPNAPFSSGGFFINIRYTSAANKPEYVVGPGPDAWTLGTLANYGDPSSVTKGGQTAAVFDNCAEGCTGDSWFLYENDAQQLLVYRNQYGNRNWNWWPFENVTGYRVVPEPGAALAMTRFSPEGVVSPKGLRIYVDVSRQLQEYTWNGTDTSWVHSELLLLLSFAAAMLTRYPLGTKQWPLSEPGEKEYHAPWISATSWSPTGSGGGLENVLLTLLFNNGSVVVHWFDAPSLSWKTGFPTLVGVTALAVNADLRAYCVQEGQVREYNIDKTKPAAWTLVSNVTLAPALPSSGK